jgi:ferredoxin
VGHLAGKDVYRQLAEKLDGLGPRVPDNDALRSVLAELYPPAFAELVVRMPSGLANLERIHRVTGFPRAELERLLPELAEQGLVADLWHEERAEYWYTPSPMVIGLFEFTMMRSGPEADLRRRAALFREYFADGAYLAKNLANGEAGLLSRAVPHEAALEVSAGVEILDHERASFLVEEASSLAIGICACRHERLHSQGHACRTPLETCTSFGFAADYLVRHGLARRASRGEVTDILVRSRELGLLVNADNVQRRVTFMCHCCACCCHLVRGITEFGYPNTIVSSNYLVRSDLERCNACGLCLRACPVGALGEPLGTRQQPTVDESRCLGCGVCVTRCRQAALRLESRTRRVFHPETTFERVILQRLERGTLQHLLFDHPNRVDHRWMRALLGGLLRLGPVRRALVGDLLRSTFLRALAQGAKLAGVGEFVGL